MIKLNLIWEIGFPSDEDLKKRSAIFNQKSINTAVLMLHVENVSRAPVQFAKDLSEKIMAEGGKVELHTFPSEHIVPQDKVKELMIDFLSRVMK